VLKQYRRRFVLSTMLLIALVLLISLSALFVIQYRNSWEETKNTMSLVAGPWDRPGEGFRALETLQPPEPPEGEDGERLPPMRGQRGKLNLEDTENIITVFVDSETGTLSILDKNSEEIDSAILYDAVKAARDSREEFGLLRQYGLLYYRESTQLNEKYAFTSVSYLRTRLLRSFLGLLLIFVLSMVLFSLISIWLSKRAAKPMEQAIDMERQFVADISHDLKTPITVILANNSILRSDPEARVGEQEQWLDSTDTAAKNMMELIGQMLTLSSLESVERTVNRESLDLSNIAEKCALQMESVAYDRGVILDTDIRENIHILGDRDYAERICSGLMENALKYEPDGGTVFVRLERQKKKALFRVENAGSVIAPEDLPHIFERFYRGDKARTGHKGYGLGLPIIKQMTELLGGEITVESSQENGTVFTVLLNTDEG
jgi:signal transduction histidine kinase